MDYTVKPQWLMWEAALTDEQCDKIIELAKAKLPIKEASTFGGHDKSRKTDIRWMPDADEFAEIHALIRCYCLEANKYFNVELSHLPPMQFTEYADVGHKYDWHHDVNWGRNDGSHRKLSVVVQLSNPKDYKGGDFEFRYIENPDKKSIVKRGTVICFLPYHYHKVSAITKGSRTSLVGWYEGPEWK